MPSKWWPAVSSDSEELLWGEAEADPPEGTGVLSFALRLSAPPGPPHGHREGLKA